MIVVFYSADTGRITECASAPLASIQADDRPWIEVAEFRPDWDVTHHVVGGAVVEVEAP